MKNEELYHKTIGILVKAYLNDTLQHSKCQACAVGNLVCANMDITQYELHARIFENAISCELDGWPSVFITNVPCQRVRPENYTGEAKEQIDSTGYLWEELAKIEFAFENSDEGYNDDEWIYNGLMDVVEVLGEIHEVSEEQTEETKKLFVKA